MGIYDDLKKTIRSMVLFEERLDQIISKMGKHDIAIGDHEKRLIRIETMIEMAREARSQRRLE